MPYKSLYKKREYQRDWVRQKRSKGSTSRVRPIYNFNGSPSISGGLEKFRGLIPIVDADGNPVYEEG